MSESKTIQVTATPEVLAEMAVRPVKREDGALDGVTLHWPSGTYAGMVGRLPVEDPGARNPLAYVRAWLVGHITAAYEAGKAKAEGGKASDIDLGWHFAMGQVAQILGVDDSGDPKAIEARIRAEVGRLKDGAADLTAEVEGTRADMAKELAKALQMTHLVPWSRLLEEARDLAAADVDELRARIADLTAEVERLTAEANKARVEDATSSAGEVQRALVTGRRQGWEAAIEAMDKAADEDRAAMLAAGDALKAAQERDTLAKNRVVGTSYAATTLRRAAQKAGES